LTATSLIVSGLTQESLGIPFTRACGLARFCHWGILEGSRAYPPFMKPKAKLFQSQREDCQVKPEDLKRLNLVRELLQLLNDPYVGPMKLAETVAHIPVFAARCRKEAALYRPRAEVEQIERALNVIGTRGIEKVLLELLEDLTVLKSDLESK
jgi:hypothetical protein